MGFKCWVLAAAIIAGASSVVAAKDDVAVAELKDRGGKVVGRIEMRETNTGVLLRIRIKGLPPGSHALHVHESGDCGGNFGAIGGIYNPYNAQHGLLSDNGPMVGDLPNLHLPASGETDIEILNPFLSIAKDSEDGLLDADGASIVVKEKPDDYVTQPDGNSGAPIACGPIVAQN